MIERITQIDFAVLNYIQEHFRCSFFDFLMPLLSRAAELGLVWIIIAVIMLFFKKSRRCGVLMLVSMALTILIGEFTVKNIVCRVRPCNVNTAIDMLVRRPQSFSFPSGHTGASFAAAMSICLNKKWYWGLAAILFAALIGFSRLYLYVHYPTDVLAGMALGMLVAVIVWAIAKKLAPQHNLRKSR